MPEAAKWRIEAAFNNDRANEGRRKGDDGRDSLYRQCHWLRQRRPDYYLKSTTTSTISQMGNVQTKSEITASTKRMKAT